MSAVRAKRVLLVHDNFVARETFSMLLGSCGYQVDLAPCVSETLARLLGPEGPDVVVLELKALQNGCWPRDDGWGPVPVVAFCDSPEQFALARALGACACLCEPLGPIELLQAVRRCCEGEAAEAALTPTAPPQPIG
jgi:CheY-like chemotaxis protein